MKNKIIISVVLLIISTGLKAQTGGPGQPEFMQFKPATATDLVNPTSGSFSYNIPLFDVGGYPVNLSYQSGISMEDVASIVGLGWNLNIGEVMHTVRGLPDDFSGDVVTRTIFMKPNITYGGNTNVGLEITGLNIGAGINMGMGIFYNNYNGYGAEQSFGVNISLHKGSNPGKASIGLGIKANSQSGVDIYAKPSVSMHLESSSGLAATGSLGGMISVNSREGLKTSVNASMDISQNTTMTHNSGRFNKSSKNYTDDIENPIAVSIASASAAYSFSKIPEIPRVTYPFKTLAFAGSFKAGAEVFFMHPHGELRGYYTSQELSTNIIHTPAYGYLYSENSSGLENVLLDFNREKDQPYIKDASINIGIPFFTNDIYTVNAQGIGGSFQLNRGDVGVVFDNKVSTSGTSVNLGAEVGFGNALHVGAALSTTLSSSSSGKWESDITPYLAFKGETTDQLYQSAYFKNVSDVSVDANGLYNRLKGDKPVEVKINDANTWGTEVKTTSNLVLDDDDLNPILPGNYLKTIRDPRTINIQFLTAAQASVSGLEKKIKEYPVNTFDCSRPTIETERITPNVRQPHHISEMISTNIDGMRYVFGLPTYNLTQKEVSFTLDSTSVPGTDGLVNYRNHPAWGTNGKDGFYESTLLPPYVTSNLLTAVLSPDYIDIDNNGPSMNDVGNYVKINYSKAGTYKWRTPYGKDQATFNKAFLSDHADNKASYIFGEKELWYIHSIESKTEVAEFYYDTNGRKDGLGVKDENGGKDVTQKLYKLDSIKVYSINERVLKGNAAIPIRIIYFNYDYELCKQINNSLDNSGNGGKLTLKKVSFASGKSKRELLSPYKFNYGEMPSGFVVNPVYNPRNVNRFGNYQENIGTSDIDISTALSNIDFPYATQDEIEMTKNSYAWNLTKITLPGSGTIKVQYEPHHYAYTQDKRCMQMFPLEDTGSLYTGIFNGAQNYTIKFKLEKPISGLNAYEQLLYKYFNNDLTQFYYYKALVNLKPDIPEWISGYCKIRSIALSGTDYALINLEPVCKNDDDNCAAKVNPIVKNAWQFMRMNRQDLCYGSSGNISATGLQAFLQSNPFGQVHNQVNAFINGFNNYAALPPQEFASSMISSKSFFRLYSPDKNKIIGGSRVRRIITEDNWSQETDGSSSDKQYTIDYVYTENEKNPVTNQMETISSGVMEYEPFNGQDENPLRHPEFIDQHIKMAPDNRLYVETPFNESLFPASNLIYSKVKIISNKTDLNVPGQGYQEIESFTAKDYPVSNGKTDLGNNHEQKTNPVAAFAMSIFGISEFHDYITLSQGFSIILNDMHGKQKATRNYNGNGALISSEQFEYKIAGNLNLINGSNQIYQSDKLGISVSAICDSRNTEHSTTVIGVNTNLDMAFVPLVPLTLFVPLPDMSVENTRINTVAFNKIVNKKGILTKKTVTENGAAVSTENILFDDKTGFVVLSKTTNEFNDSLYKFHYPAHWIYEGLGSGYISSDLEFSVSLISNNYFTVTHDVFNALAVGDEIISAGSKYWITEKQSAGNKIKIESNIVGTPVAITSGKVLRSGRRNQLMQEAGSVVTHINPITGNKIIFSEIGLNAKVINASMQEFADERVKYCECDTVKGKPNTNPRNLSGATNPYITGEKGNWYPSTTWAYLTDRERSVGFNSLQTNIRSDGSFTDYKNFWRYDNNLNPGWQRFATGWQWVETVTKKDVNGLTLETSDVLGRHNALLTGYKNKLVVAEAGNARINEILFDGFEDWNYLSISGDCGSIPFCIPKIVNWDGIFVQDTVESHSGKYSGKLIRSGQTITIPVSPVILTPEVNERENSPTSHPTKPICAGTFKPTVNMKYVISAWVRDNADPLAITFNVPAIHVGSDVLHTNGDIIDGWQRIYGEFTIPQGAASLTLKFIQGSGTTWFDDIRISPFDTKMITHVYDGNTQKLTFTSDENNYFTKYNYDAADNLESINKETEKGVQTVKEVRSSTVKLP
ncbi:hypothetical protein [Stygiobacter electus]|uniref:Uncharacterized protein n=1 Tax=Stygiobacter electus TaxID=3032292 RepID=A0AAE3P100_9BACT|nr:hypothetical protein [Stygiobacter electus]MDF1612334.1 hypothetical protein [Stygiobacter electus]